MAAIWRSAAVALRDFNAAVDETEAVFPKGVRIPFPDFQEELKVALRLTALRVPDHRRDVVHVMDVYEVRQWKLPVVFVCGLLEKQFPLYHAQDPLLPDEVRMLLGLRTTDERDAEERFLFDLATTRASETLVLSYPRFDQKGAETLRSFYLDRFLEAARNVTKAPARSARPEPLGARPPARRPLIYDESLRQWLAKRFERVSVTALESFLQCPFQFFAGQALRLADPPVEPEERLDARVQGKIMHEVLREWLYSRGAIEPLLEAAFGEACRREQIPSGYRTESVRLELLRNLRRFIPQALATGAQPEKAEQDVELQLEDNFTLTGRIDRIDTSPDGRALIIDYKNSAPDKIKALVKAHLEGRRIQGGVYMLALRQAGREVAGMLFAGLRGKTAWDGWSTLGGKPSAPDELAAVMASARQAALDAIAKIRDGVIEPKPADPRLCQYCSFYDACRFESAAKVSAGGEAEE
jgi:ATP-dependent helicase/nuclease subunit B